MLVCPKCDQENPEVARFCFACGTPLHGAASREERKVVTVLFADLVGFTSRAEAMDPEDVRALLSPYHQRLRAELERFGGTVEKFIGDAVVALFGAPVTHEDDPERAVRAALAIRDWVREDEAELQLRIAVNTGEALIALGARPEAGEGMASGDVVNTTARLQSAAPVNGILVGEATWRATRDRIDYVEHDAVTAKGKAEPIRVWEPVHARARVGMDLEQQSLTPLVGRERELGLLFDAFDRVCREREPQLVTLVGVPGIGKSRLVSELFQRIDSSPDLVWWRQGRALPYGVGVSLWALGEMVKAQAGIHENDDEQETARKLRESVAGAVEEHECDWVVRQLEPLLGLGDDTATDRDTAFAAWRRYLERLADEHPLVLVFEDLHWADDVLLDFVDHLTDWATGVPILVLGTARPELLDRRPSWGGGKLNASTLALSPLADADSARVIAGVLEQALLPAELQETLLERAGGNPLYAEQFARLFVEHGAIAELPVPENVQGTIAARLDALPEGEKQLLQEAAVFGKVFWSSALGAAEADTTLLALERKGFVRRERRSAVAGQTEYAFRHVLVREVAYGQIPRSARAAKHVAAAGWVESLGRTDDHAELIAHHYATALELLRAAGQPVDDLATPARLAFRRAGDRAAALNSFVGAARFYREALELWPEDDRECPALLLALGRAEFHAGDTSGATLQRAVDASLALGLSELGAEAEALAAETAWYRGDREVLLRHLGHALELIEPLPDSRAKAWILSQAARYSMLGGDHVEAIEYGRRALDLATRLELPEVRVHALNNIGSSRARLGDAGGIADLEASVALAEEISSLELARSLNNLGSTNMMLGHVRRCWELEARALVTAERFGLGSLHRFTSANILSSLYRLGRWDEVLERAEELLAEGVPTGSVDNVHFSRATIRVGRGDLDGALADSSAALETARRVDEPQTIIPAMAIHGYVLHARGEDDDAGKLMDELLARLQQRAGQLPFGASAEIVNGWLEVRGPNAVNAVIATSEGGPETPWRRAAQALVVGDYASAVEIYRKTESVPDTALTLTLLAEQLIANGNRAAGSAHLEEALTLYRSVGATHFILRAERLLPASA